MLLDCGYGCDVMLLWLVVVEQASSRKHVEYQLSVSREERVEIVVVDVVVVE